MNGKEFCRSATDCTRRVYVYKIRLWLMHYGVFIRFRDVYKRREKHTFCHTFIFDEKQKNKIECPCHIIGLYYYVTITKRGYTTKIRSSVYLNVSEQYRISMKISLFDVSSECWNVKRLFILLKLIVFFSQSRQVYNM